MEHKKKPRLDFLESDYDTESDTDSDSSSVSSFIASLARSNSLPSLALFGNPTSAANIPSFAASTLANSNIFPFTAVSTISQPHDAAAPLFTSSTTLNSTIGPVKANARPRLRPVAPNTQPSTSTSSNPPAAFPTSAPSRLGESDDGEQLRASFKAACEEINRELDIIMQPLKKKQDTLKSIEDYIVILSKRARIPFKVDLADDNLTTKVSLRVDNNRVTVIRPHTPPNQQGQDSQQQSEGAASNAAGPSGSSQNNSGGDEACWMPPVNPFTSSVTLRQHLEAASNNVRPRRMRPPPGFHPTPQYNVANVGASTSGIEGQGTSAGSLRPPPGFHGSAPPARSSSAAPGYYGILDSQTFINDLFRQQVSAPRQLDPRTTSLLNFYEAAHQERLLYSLVPRQVPQSDIRQRYFLSQGYRGPLPPPPSIQLAYEQAHGTRANELWRHYSNASAVPNVDLEDDPRYWDDFLQKEVYDMLNTDQESELWRQFAEYQRVHYAPGSLRTGSTLFYSDIVGPSIHGPVGHSRPRIHRRCRPIENIRIQCNVEQLQQTPRNASNSASGTQDVLTLSDRFKNTSIANPKNRPPKNTAAPQTRNAMLGALLLKRLKERAALLFPETNGAMNVPATTAAPSANTSSNVSGSSTANNSSPAQSGASSMDRSSSSSASAEQLPCTYCTQNEKPAGSPAHVLRDGGGRTVCPVLREKPCPICNKAGDNAHTVHECPVRKQWDMDGGDKSGKKPT